MHRGYTKRWRKRWDKGYHKDPVLWIMMDYFIDFAHRFSNAKDPAGGAVCKDVVGLFFRHADQALK